MNGLTRFPLSLSNDVTAKGMSLEEPAGKEEAVEVRRHERCTISGRRAGHRACPSQVKYYYIHRQPYQLFKQNCSICQSYETEASTGKRLE
jgi:hypothetical protein